MISEIELGTGQKVDFKNQEITVFSDEITATKGGGKKTPLSKALSPTLAVDVKVSWKPNVPRPIGSVPMGPEGFYRSPPPRHKFWVEDENGNEKFNSPFELSILKNHVTITAHECGVDIEIQNTALGLKAPPGGYHYRKPGECRREPKEPEPPPLPPNELDGYTPPPFDMPQGFNPDDEVIAIIDTTYLYDATSRDPYSGRISWTKASEQTSLEKITFPGGIEKTLAGSNLEKVFVEADFKFSSNMRTSTNPPYQLQGSAKKWIHPKQQTWKEQDPIRYSHLDYRPSDTTWGGKNDRLYVAIFHGRFGDIFPSQEAWNPQIIRHSSADINRVGIYQYRAAWCYKIEKLLNPWADNPPFLIPPPPPCCMECCSNNKDQNNDALLREILKRVKNTEARLGADDYPFYVPESIIKQSESWISSLLPQPKIQIKNTQEFLRYIFTTIDALLGEFEIPIEIKDVDPSTPGEQPKGIKILNVAEGISELAGLGITSSINSELTINMLSRILYELAALRQSDADGNSKTKALIEFFGFKTDDIQEKIKLTFTPGKDKLDETLKETEHPITITVFDDEKKTYKHDMAKVLEAAAIIKAVNMKKINIADTASAAAAIKKNVKEIAKNKEKQDETLKNDLEKDFDQACQDFEQGFIATPGIDDSANPYGESYESRPKVIRLDKQTPKE